MIKVDKKITLSLFDYNVMVAEAKSLKNEIHKLETIKLVKVVELFTYSLYRNTDQCDDRDEFISSQYIISVEHLQGMLSKREINHINEQNKATELIQELYRFKNQEIIIQGLTFWQRFDFLFNKRIDLKGGDDG